MSTTTTTARTPLDVQHLHALADEYAEAVAIHYGGDEANPREVAGELRAQAGSGDAHEVILDRRATSWEAEILYDRLIDLAVEYGRECKSCGGDGIAPRTSRTRCSRCMGSGIEPRA